MQTVDCKHKKGFDVLYKINKKPDSPELAIHTIHIELLHLVCSIS